MSDIPGMKYCPNVAKWQYLGNVVTNLFTFVAVDSQLWKWMGQVTSVVSKDIASPSTRCFLCNHWQTEAAMYNAEHPKCSIFKNIQTANFQSTLLRPNTELIPIWNKKLRFNLSSGNCLVFWILGKWTRELFYFLCIALPILPWHIILEETNL